MALITASEYKAYAGISDTSLDARLAVLIPIAQARLESMCGRPSGGFETAAWTQNFSARGGSKIYAPCWPVTSITSVSYRDADGDLTAESTDSYQISSDTRFVERYGGQVSRGWTSPNSLEDDQGLPLTGQSPNFGEGNNNYQIVYVGGYSTIPAELKMAMYRTLDQMIADTRQAGDIKSESDGHYSYTKMEGGGGMGDTGDPLSLVSLLSNWRSLL